MSKISKEESRDLYRMYESPPVDFIAALKLDLSIRENNSHAGSRLGGNPSQYLYLLCKNIKTEHSLDDSISIRLEDNNLVFKIPQEVKLLPLREALNKFWETCPDKYNVSMKDMINTSFLKDLGVDKMDIFLLIKALDATKDVVTWLDRGSQFMDSIYSFFDLEVKEIEKQYLLEMGLPENYFEKVNALEKEYRKIKNVSNEPDRIKWMMHDHPIWGEKLKKSSTRREAMISQILSDQDFQKLNFIGSFPVYISGFVFRSFIGIDRIVKLNLDENIKWMNSVNNTLKNFSVDEDEDEET